MNTVFKIRFSYNRTFLDLLNIYLLLKNTLYYAISFDSRSYVRSCYISILIEFAFQCKFCMIINTFPLR
jgi:hypothetical protein